MPAALTAAAVVGGVLAVAWFGDEAASRWATHVSPALQRLARAVTMLGTSGYMIVAALAVALVSARRARMAQGSARARWRSITDRALTLVAAVAVSGLLVQGIKHLVGRERPRLSGGLEAFVFHPLSLSNGFASFPSGHATSAFAAATALGLMRLPGRVALFGLAAAIGLSRVILGEHFPSDVLAGAVLGIGSALVLRDMSVSAGMQTLRSEAARADGGWRVARAAVAHRWSLPILIAGCFAIATPPSDVFGSELVEHAKDGFAILVALAGLTVRALVIGAGPASEASEAPALRTRGAYALCRNPLALGDALIFAGLMLMHGGSATMALGAVALASLTALTIRGEEAELSARYGAAYAAYTARVPRWLPRRATLGQGLPGLSFAAGRFVRADYPAIGLTVIGLAVAEFYEEIEEPLIRSRLLELGSLAAIMLAAALAMASLWLVERRRNAAPDAR